MKKVLPFLSLAFLWVFTTNASAQGTETKSTLLKGAWQIQESPGDEVVIFTDDYFSYANYDKAAREFRVTFGGTYKTENGQIVTRLEFHSGDSTQVGQSLSYPYTFANDVLTITVDGENTTWKQLDNGIAPLAGNWHITQRLQQGKMQAIHQSGGRKTVKILSGTRFQWVAMNTDTKEFFGTGGGTYTFQNGKYTETIEFFSRDNSRVGTSLTFNGKVEKDGWHHSGLSSSGDKINEVWNKTK